MSNHKCNICQGSGIGETLTSSKGRVIGTIGCSNCNGSGKVGVGHQFDSKVRGAEAIKSTLETCLLAAIETGSVKAGDFQWSIMNNLIEKYASEAIAEEDYINERD